MLFWVHGAYQSPSGAEGENILTAGVIFSPCSGQFLISLARWALVMSIIVEVPVSWWVVAGRYAGRPSTGAHAGAGLVGMRWRYQRPAEAYPCLSRVCLRKLGAYHSAGVSLRTQGVHELKSGRLHQPGCISAYAGSAGVIRSTTPYSWGVSLRTQGVPMVQVRTLTRWRCISAYAGSALAVQ